MCSSTRTLLLFVSMLVALNAQAQSERKQLTGTMGSISGRVMLDGEPAPGVKVIAFKRERQEPVASAKTDQYGHFRLNDLPSDHYHIMPLAPAYVAPEQAEPGRPGKPIPLAEGERIEGLDFTLTRGSVITGRITDEDGQPLTGERVTLFQLDPQGQKRPLFYSYSSLHALYDFGTDDRGIYRIFGLPPGRYLVSAGKQTEEGGRIGRSRYHPHTFYPGVADESKAGIIELKAGTEATGIDIACGRALNTYSASGRVVDAGTGKPIPNAQLTYGTTYVRGSSSGGSSSSGPNTDAGGNFRLDGLLPGTFYVTATPEAGSGMYSSAASFQITDQDITGLEIKFRRGSSISGVLAVEGARGPDVMAKLSRLKLWASTQTPDVTSGTVHQSSGGAVGPDGGFSIAGLHPGKVYLHIGRDPEAKGFFVSRVERGGVESAGGIEVEPGEHVTGVRVVLGYASGRIRGQVKIEGGKLPPDARTEISVWRVDGPPRQSTPRVQVDPDGRFVIESLAAGEYRVTLTVYPPFPPGGGSTGPLTHVSKIVSVTNGAESEVTFVVKLNAEDEDR